LMSPPREAVALDIPVGSPCPPANGESSARSDDKLFDVAADGKWSLDGGLDSELRLDEAGLSPREDDTSTVEPANTSADATMPSSPGCSAEDGVPSPAESGSQHQEQSSSERPTYRRNTPPPPIITSETPRSTRTARLPPRATASAQPVPEGKAVYPVSTRSEVSEPAPGVGPPTPLPVTTAPSATQEVIANASGGELIHPRSTGSTSLPVVAALEGATPKDLSGAREPLEAPVVPPLAVFSSPKPVASVPHPLSGRGSRPGSGGSRRPASRDASSSARQAQDVGLPPLTSPAPPDRASPSLLPASRPSSRPPAAASRSSSRPGSRSESGIPSKLVPLGADPLGALAVSRQQTPTNGAQVTPVAPRASPLPPRGEAPRPSPPQSADVANRKRSQSSQPTPRSTQSAEPTLRRAGSLEAPARRHSTRSGSHGSRPKAQRDPLAGPQSSPPPVVAGFAGAGDDFSSSMSGTMRRRAEKVAADQNATAKDREDSLLRMLDNRQTRQRAVM